MSLLLYALGALALVSGAITIGFGISIELSFGNSLIVAGTSAAVGGLIVVGLGSVVAQLRRIAEALATGTPIRPSRMPEMFEAAGAPAAAAARVPFPPKPKSGISRPPSPVEQPVAAPTAAEKPAEDRFAGAPTLPNPDEPPVEVHEEVSLSPLQPAPPPAQAETAEAARPAPLFGFGRAEKPQPEPEVDHGWRLPPIPGRPQPEAAPPPMAEEKPEPPLASQTTHFDAMWPAAEPKPAEPATTAFGRAEPPVEPDIEPGPEPGPEPVPEPKAEPKAELEAQPEAASGSEPAPAASPAPAQPETASGRAGEGRNVAILKSGVVDGMGYTLYVDGSIEAELPQGTLRFTSINDLRNYLENNGEP